MAIVVKRVANHVVHGQDQLHALGGRLVHQFLGQADALFIQQGIAHFAALRLDEGVGHAAADEQRVNLIDQVGDDADLVLDLRAAQDGHERAHRVGERLAHHVQFLADEVTGHGGEVVGHALGGGVRAVRGAERVVHKHIRHGGELLREGGIVLFFFGVEAQVLQQDGFARLHFRRELLGAFADHVAGELHFKAQLLAQALGHRREGIFHVEFALRAAQVGAEDHSRAFIQQIADGGQSGVDARFVRDVLIGVERHVEVAAHENLLAGNVDILYGLFVIHTGVTLLPIFPSL